MLILWEYKKLSAYSLKLWLVMANVIVVVAYCPLVAVILIEVAHSHDHNIVAIRRSICLS